MNDMRLIVDFICQYFDVDVKDIMKVTRVREIVRPRQFAMYLARMFTKRTLYQIGTYFGKDHATVIHAIKTVRDLADTDYEFGQLLHSVKLEFESKWVHLVNEEYDYAKLLTVKGNRRFKIQRRHYEDRLAAMYYSSYKALKKIQDHILHDRIIEGYRRVLIMKEIRESVEELQIVKLSS